jgi:nicotinate-nucleotide pyrophosphorylase (carboxylating)
MTFALQNFDLANFIKSSLAEDLGQGGDITSNAIIPADLRFHAQMLAREELVVAGLPLAKAFFQALELNVEAEIHFAEGAVAKKGSTLMTLNGKARGLLTAERTALNTVQHLSGIATLTREYVKALDGTGATLLDTRKTAPGLRVLQKYATKLGGATNHRMRLDDAAMIKDNHIVAAGGIAEALARCKKAGVEHIILEVDRLDQIEAGLGGGATWLLLDNMSLAELQAAVALVAGRVPCEASGGVTLKRIKAIAETGVDYISVGRITQSAPAVDIGLDFQVA